MLCVKFSISKSAGYDMVSQIPHKCFILNVLKRRLLYKVENKIRNLILFEQSRNDPMAWGEFILIVTISMSALCFYWTIFGLFEEIKFVIFFSIFKALFILQFIQLNKSIFDEKFFQNSIFFI